MTRAIEQHDADAIRNRIMTIRGHRVILDHDLAAVYGVSTKVLNQAVKRSAKKFPADFMFQLAPQEVKNMWSQIVTTSQRFRSAKYRPLAFTEHGALMAATVLSSERAVQMSVFVVRAFVRMRDALTDTRELSRKLAALEREVKARLDGHDTAIVDVLQRIMDLIDPAPAPEPARKKIGFSVKEQRSQYRTKKRRDK